VTGSATGFGWDDHRVRFGILGSTQAWSGNGAALPLGGAGRRALLALLVLDAGRTVGVPRLIDGLYGERPPAGVGNALQSQVSRLRGALRQPGQPDPIVNDPAGYRLAVDPQQVDAHRFTRLAAHGREALERGDPAEASRLLGEALALWRGQALADVADAPFAAAQIVRLEESRLTATEDRWQAELELGRARQATAELPALAAAHPLRERLQTQLVLALYRDGRQAEALDAYSRARTALADALGADPGPELAAAHLAVLRGTARPAASAVREVTVRHLNSPARLNELIGREEELTLIQQLLLSGRLLTLTGPGGAGKTRTALETAAQHPGDSCFVDLSGLTDGDDLPQAVLSALGVRGSALPSPAEGPPPQARLAAALAGRPLLLVLDNCEHLVADAARLAADLLAACPDLRILATSREALGITGERSLPLPPLPVRAAVRLFAERAAAVQPGFDPRRDAETVTEICERLDGLPLAVELAAARLRMLSPRQIADRLDDRFRLLTGGSRTAAPRQQTLRAVVDWSWELLPEPERAALRRASVFSGGWTLEAAEAVCADPAQAGPGEVLELIGALVDKSLVIARQPEADPGARPEADDAVRYHLLQTVRAYAAERLTESGERRRAEQAHLDYFRQLAATANPQLRTADQLRWLHRLAADNDNLHAALRRADTGTALRLIGDLSGYWLLRGLRFEGAPHARRVLEALGPHPLPGLEEEYAICLMLGIHSEADRQALAAQLAVGERMMRELNRTPRRNPALTVLWAPFSGVPEEFDRVTPEEITLWQADPWHRGLLHIGEGFRHWYVTGDWAAAEREFRAGIETYRVLGDRWGRIVALPELAAITDLTGDRERSRALTDEALRLAEELDSAEDIADLYCARAQRSLRDGDLAAARADCERAIGRFQDAGVADSRARLCLVAVARAAGDPDGARALGEALLAAVVPNWYGGVWLRIQVLVELARVAGAVGDPATARRHFREALPYGVDTRNLPALADAAEALAELALQEGRPEQAARLQGVARALGHRGGPGDPDQRQVTAAALAALGDDGYTRAHALGAALPPDAAVTALIEAAQS
jgi:predicted ATPase/DNA-binding SARP family transcriptional activator